MATTDTVGVKYEADIKQLQAALDKIIADNAKIEKQVDEIGDEYTQTGNQGAAAMNKVDNATKGVQKSTNQMTGIVRNAGAAMLAAFSVQAIIEFGKQVVDVTGRFQRYAAVLENTLGSKSEAQRALLMIQDFAAKTPFSVDELTASFVKLANQGFEPTSAQMTKLGDLAASQGKSFDMLTEAIIDAQTGEFERLKEFGIRASKEGDNVKFTFKGVETQTKFTADAMREYIISLGAAQGVTGGMAAQSQTLEGKISNLGDSWDKFLLVFGEHSQGIIGGTIDLLTVGLEGIGTAISFSFNPLKHMLAEANAAAAKLLADIESRAGEYTATMDSVMIDGEMRRLRLMIQIRKDAIGQLLAIGDEEGVKTSRNQLFRYEKELEALEEIQGKKEVSEKKAFEAGAEQRKKEAEKLRADMIKMAFDTQAFRIELMDEGIGKELAKQQLGYLKEREQYRNNKEALLLIDQKYLKERAEIIKKFDVEQITVTRDIGKEVKKEREEEVKTQFEQAQEGLKNWEVLQEQKKERDKEREQQAADDRIAIEEATFTALQGIGNLLIQDQAKLAEFQKALALFQLGIDTARAISAGIAASAGVPFPGNLVAIATTVAAVITNLAQAKSILSSSNPPGFKEGVVDFLGKGTETSDSNPVLISQHESVIKAKATKAWKDELVAMNSGRFDDFVMSKYVLPALQEDRKQRDTASNMAASFKFQQMQFDDSRMVATMERNKPASSKDIQKLDKSIQRAFKDSAYVRSKMWKN